LKGKAQNIVEGCKLYYCGGKRTRNGVGICLRWYWQDKVIDVQRISERIMRMKLVTPRRNIVSAYEPQQGCEQWEKDWFLTNWRMRLTGYQVWRRLLLKEN
jgi:hypothetical protein